MQNISSHPLSFRRPIFQLKASRALLFLLLLVNSGIIFTSTQFIQIPFAFEVYIGLLSLYFLFFVLPRMLLKGLIPQGGIFVLGLILFISLLSSLNAFLVYGQPIQYGFLEERRVLAYLIFFPVLHALIAGIIDPKRLFTYILVIATICYLNSILYYLTVFQFSTGLEETNIRGERTAIGIYYILFSAIYAFFFWQSKNSLKWGIASMALMLYMIIFSQTRQLIIAMLAIILLIIYKKPKNLIRILIGIAILLISALLFSRDFLTYQFNKYTLLFVTMFKSGDEIRAQTVNIAWNRILENPLWGNGALSAQWNDGFHRFYGVNFYISDIGIMGTIFKYGIIIAPLLVIFYYFYLFKLIKKLPKTIEIQTCKYFIILAMILNLFQPVIEFYGSIIGLILAVIIYYKYWHRNESLTFITQEKDE